MDRDYLCYWVEVSDVWYFDEVVEDFVFVVVDADDVSASCFDFHGVAYDFFLGFGAAEYYAWCASSIRAIVPCFSSPPLNPSAWM